jgi:hypothetical protein
MRVTDGFTIKKSRRSDINTVSQNVLADSSSLTPPSNSARLHSKHHQWARNQVAPRMDGMMQNVQRLRRLHLSSNRRNAGAWLDACNAKRVGAVTNGSCGLGRFRCCIHDFLSCGGAVDYVLEVHPAAMLPPPSPSATQASGNDRPLAANASPMVSELPLTASSIKPAGVDNDQVPRLQRFWMSDSPQH